MRLNFKRYTAELAAAATLLTACYEDHTDLENQTTRIGVSPEIEAFQADGTAAVSGNSTFTSVVLVKSGTRISSMGWEAELVDWAPAVDESGPWMTLQRVPVVSEYTELAGPNTVAVTESGFELTVQPNPGYGRRCTLRITAEDGTVQDYELLQYGELADAAVTPVYESVEISFQGGPVDVPYTTNMGDRYAYSIAYEQGGPEGWLTAEHRAEGLLTLTAEPWDDMERDRRATLTITVGDDATSKASVDIPVVQLKRAEYYYVYGSALGEEAATALQMKRETDDTYRVDGFFFATADNLICINKDSRTGAPGWYLGADGKLKSWSADVTASDLTIEANGCRTLTVDFAAGTWSWTRRNSTPNCMPDEELAGYPTKDYPTAAGGVKTWMTVSLHWNGGPDIGSVKLGSGLVGGTKTGGYGKPSVTTEPYDVRNPAYDTVENGGSIEELRASDGTPLASKYGRLYSSFEAVTGQPNGALNKAYQIASPYGEPGQTLVDATGATVSIENILMATLAAADDDAKAEADHPVLKMQIQGICPYGWHIANLQDWRDLIWAAAQASKGSQYEIAASSASYKAIGGGSIANLSTILFDASWNTYSSGSPISPLAAEFGFNMFIQGWRLYDTGYNYGATSSDPRFYAWIPVLGQYTSKKAAFWRIYISGHTKTDMTLNDGFDLGNGSGAAIRCVKNYK